MGDDSGDDDDDDSGNSPLCHNIVTYKGDQCAYVDKFCPNALAGGFLNYIRARYCWFKAVPFVFYIFAVRFVVA